MKFLHKIFCIIKELILHNIDKVSFFFTVQYLNDISVQKLNNNSNIANND